MAKKIPMRQCVGCRQMKGKNEMLRILKNTKDEIILDVTGKQNGRGAYICRNKECFLLARQNKGLERSFQRSIPEQTYAELLKEFECLNE